MLLQYFDYQYITKGLFCYFGKAGKLNNFIIMTIIKT